MVPVEVEFQQVLGSSLTADVYWDDGEVVTLGHGDRQLFYVAPGPHAVHVASRVASMERTAGQVSVVVGVDRPTRIVLEAQARFSGVDVRILVWQGERVVVDRVFTPTPERHGREPVDEWLEAPKGVPQSHGRQSVVWGFTPGSHG